MPVTPWVLGMGRSGTTLMADLINHLADHRVIFEPLPVILGGPDQSTWDFKMPYRFLRSPRGNQGFVEKYRALVEADLPFTPWLDREPISPLPAARIIKDAYGLMYAGLLQREIPRLQAVCVVRHPIVTAISRLKTQHWWDGTEAVPAAWREDTFLKQQVAIWCGMHQKALPLLDWDRTLLVYHEHLLARPLEVLASVTDFLGLPLDNERALAVLGKPTHTASEKRTGLPDISTAEHEECQAVLRKYGLAGVYDEDGKPTEGRWWL